MSKSFLFLLLVPAILFAQEESKIILTEIMFNPQSGNNEFIELYNLSENESIDLTGYKIKYQASNPDIIQSAGEGTTLAPLSFAVIFEGDYDFAAGIYKNLVPSEALVLKISDNSFGTFGMSNSSDRIIRLLNPLEDTVEVYTYSANNNSGISDQKIILNKNDLPENWSNSKNINGTPGLPNSTSQLKFDLCISSVSIFPVVPIKDDNVSVNVRLKNIGTETADICLLEIYKDSNHDSSGSASELIYQNSFLNLLANDSVTASVEFLSAVEGEYDLIIKFLYDKDENLRNDLKYFNFIVSLPGAKYNDLVINEIMYTPSNQEPEWLEIFNRSNSPINIKNWRIWDANSSTKITNKEKLINSGSYFILTKDSSIRNFYTIPCEVISLNLPSLNNSGDEVVLKDSLGLIIDSLNYQSSWGGNSEGKSLERISITSETNNEKSWGTSVSRLKATPGKINSLSPKEFDLSIMLAEPEKDFGIVGELFHYIVVVKNLGSKEVSGFNLRIFNDADKDSSADPDEFVAESNGGPIAPGDTSLVRIGIKNFTEGTNYFIAVLENGQDDNVENNILFPKMNGVKTNEIKNDLVINELMYAPNSPEPEWFEIFNRSSKEINLKNYYLADANDSVRIIDNSINLNPGQYLVIANDTLFSQFYSGFKFQIKDFPSLNNSGDKIILLDSLKRVIDSLEFSSSWGGTFGKSLERINSENSSIDSSNWKSSRDKKNGTPGRINSVTQKDFDILISEILFTPKFPLAGENVNISAKLFNIGKKPAGFKIELYEDTDLDSIPNILIYSSGNLNIDAGDSSVIPLNYIITELKTPKGFYISAVFPNDQDSLNNTVYFEIKPGYPEKSIIINEIMYNPEVGEPEWVELFNSSNEKVNLKSWMISDLLPGGVRTYISTEDYFLDPSEYFIAAHDTTFLTVHPDFGKKIKFVNFGTLGNTEDGIIIYDFRGAIIDSLHYKSTWGTAKGYSLERISLEGETNDSTNWAISLSNERSTPGKENSLADIPDYKRNDLIINEIMFDPEISNSEFIELYNPGNSAINIGGWKIADESGSSFKLSQTSCEIIPNNFFVLSADSEIFNNYNLQNFQNMKILNSGSLGLSSSGETILLKDIKGNVIDSVFYTEKWHNKNFTSTKNISLERINPKLDGNNSLNWSSSVNSSGATPGFPNSIFCENEISEEKISVSPNPFSPDNDSFEDFTIVNYNLREKTSQVRIKIFDNRGRLLRTLLNNQPSGAKGSIVFNGLEDDGTPLRMGIYIIFLEALNESSGVSEALKTIVVVARKL